VIAAGGTQLLALQGESPQHRGNVMNNGYGRHLREC
jgi:hypothetical protein